jgi:hypothetical protein
MILPILFTKMAKTPAIAAATLFSVPSMPTKVPKRTSLIAQTLPWNVILN